MAKRAPSGQMPVSKSSTTVPAAAVTIVRWAALAFVLACPLSVLATEGGTGHYIPGGAATLIDLPPTKPGWVVEPIYLNYDGSASPSKSPAASTVDAAGRP